MALARKASSYDISSFEYSGIWSWSLATVNDSNMTLHSFARTARDCSFEYFVKLSCFLLHLYSILFQCCAFFLHQTLHHLIFHCISIWCFVKCRVLIGCPLPLSLFFSCWQDVAVEILHFMSSYDGFSFWLVASNVEFEEKWGKLQQKWEWYSPPKYKQKLEWKQRGIHWALSKTLGANDCCHGAFERYSPHCLMSAEVELCQIEYWFSHSNILTYYLSCHANIILKLSEMQSKLNSLIHNLNLDKINGQYLEKYLTLFFCYNI